MAKHQRRTVGAASRARSTRLLKAARSGRAARTARKASHSSLPARPHAAESEELEPHSKGVNRQYESHLEAVAVYEKGIRRIQQHNFSRAAELLQHVVATFPEERELCERARLYLSLCDRQLCPATDEPQSLAERIYAATLALNADDVDRAIAYLDGVRREDPANDQALYMLATAYAQRGNVEVAIPYLRQAIASNPDNRVLARVDPDLAGLRAEDTIAALLQPPLLQPDSDRKRSVRPRRAR